MSDVFLKINSEYLSKYLAVFYTIKVISFDTPTICLFGKNWLFANTPSGAKASATIFSIIETAKENRLEPYAYLRYVFIKAPNLREDESIDILLPWNALDHYRSKSPHLTE